MEAVDLYGFDPNIGFANWELTAETIDRLPKTDAIIFLGVYQNIIRFQDIYSAKEILNGICEKCDVLLFEVPVDRYYGINLTVRAICTKTGEEYKSEIKPLPHIRPEFEEYLSQGEYNVSVRTENHGYSDEFLIKIGESGKLVSNCPRVLIEGECVNIVFENDSSAGLESVIEQNKNHLINTIGKDANIIETKVSKKYEGINQKRILYAIDTSNIAAKCGSG